MASLGMGSRGLLEGLVKQLWPIQDGAGEKAHVDEVKGGLVRPFLFEVVDKEFNVWGDTGMVSTRPVNGGGEAYKSGWMGLKSTPTTADSGNWSASGLSATKDGEVQEEPGRVSPNSIAQMPVPHPASRTRFGGFSAEMGAVNS